MRTFIIEDELHAEHQGEYATLDDAIQELRRRAVIPWDQEPNVAPCQKWATCGRAYEVIEYGNSNSQWVELQRMRVLDVSKEGIVWYGPYDPTSG
jgi:hypothetical protein